MSHYQDQTKKKPLIQYHKMKYNQPTIAIKDKLKKDKSAEKQNTYEPQTKKFKDFNQTKYSTQYHQNQNLMDKYKKPNPTAQGVPLTPSNVELNNNATTINKNLTFGVVKNNQKNYLNTMNNDSDISTNNHIISVNVNIQNLAPNMMDFKKNNANRYDIKPLNLKRNHQNQKNTSNTQMNQFQWHQNHQNQRKNVQNQKISNLNHQDEKIFKTDEDKRRTTTNISNAASNNNTERYMERNSILDKSNAERHIEKNDRNERKQKFRKNLQEKYIMATSPVDKDFICDEELQIRPIDKKLSLYEQKLSEKKLSIPQLGQLNQINVVNQVPNQNMNYNSSQTNNFNQTQSLLNQTSNNANQQRYAKKIDKKAAQLKDLKDFELKEDEINSIQCSQAITTLFQQQQKYMVDPTYLEKNQKAINWTVRAILIDWMRQLSHEYSLKRDTYHIGVVLLDKYLSKKCGIQKQAAQVIGATTLFIASKLEEIECRPSQSFAQSTQGICTAKDIQVWQFQICETLQFCLNPPTICSLANRLMLQWDKYITEVDYAMHHPCFEGCEKVFFKRLDQSSYRMFRQLMQFVDCLILDIQTAQYKPILIVLSLMYLIIGVKVAGFQPQEIYQMFPRVSHYLLDRSNYFNDLFQNFVSSTFGLTLLEILPSVQYVASFYNLNLTYEKPLLTQNEDDLQQMDLQEYCSYQTYNRHMLKTVTTRFRGITNTF